MVASRETDLGIGEMNDVAITSLNESCNHHLLGCVDLCPMPDGLVKSGVHFK